MPQSGSVESGRDMYAHTINTGQIEQRTALTVNVIIERLDQLAELLRLPDSTFRAANDAQGVTLMAGEQQLPLPANLLEGFQLLPRANDLDARDRRRAYAAWLVTRRPQRPSQWVAAKDHYIPLAGRVTQEQDFLQPHLSERRFVGEGPERRVERERLADVADAVHKHPAFVLLGAPGCGKSTVLHRLALTTARHYLTGASPRLPLLVTLADYRWQETPAPLDFIRQRWGTLAADDLVDLARSGHILLLADGLNEMLRLDSSGERRRRANAWERFINDYFAEESPHSSRAIIASRDQGDYDQPLGLPRVEIEPLDDDQVRQFIEAYLPGKANRVLAAIERLDLWGQARVPYSLYVLTQLYDPASGDLPPNRGRLFADYARRLLLGEKQAGHAWYELDAALAALAELGYALQQRGESTVLPAADLQALLPAQVEVAGQLEAIATPPPAVFRLACRAGLLQPDPTAAAADAHKFSHQLLQEQFAARRLLAHWQAHPSTMADLLRTPRTRRDMPDPERGEWDPLPPPPATGWEQTTILAAGMVETPDAFIKAAAAVNPALAGRCLSEGNLEVMTETRAAVQQALLADLSNSELHRRTRIQAGRVLGAVGDPRFELVRINGVEIIVPDWVEVPGGRATLGSRRWPFDRQAFDNERPQHHVDVSGFYLARYPVTNAEYGCFMKAGGYDAEPYWTPAGWQWRQGQVDVSGPVEDWLEWYRFYRDEPHRIEQAFREGRFTPDTAEVWRTLIQMSEDEVRELLVKQFPVQPQEKPRYWDDPAYNGPNQPVVGVTWYEAMAYCCWLTECLGDRGSGTGGPGVDDRPPALKYIRNEGWQARLPTEAEWEWAAGGGPHTRFPWGSQFDPDRANTLEGRILQTTPVGSYPGGAARCGALDLSGNVWEWTHSLYQPYPYHFDDGREDQQIEGRRVLRGGSWSFNGRYARVSSRNLTLPVSFVIFIGLRVALAPIIS